MTSKNHGTETKVLLVNTVQRIHDFETQLQEGTFIGVDWRGVYFNQNGVSYMIESYTWYDSNEVTIVCENLSIRIVCTTVGASSTIKKLLDYYHRVPKRSWFLHDNAESSHISFYGEEVYWRHYKTLIISRVGDAACIEFNEKCYPILSTQVLDKHVMFELETGNLYVNVGNYNAARDVLFMVQRVYR